MARADPTPLRFRMPIERHAGAEQPESTMPPDSPPHADLAALPQSARRLWTWLQRKDLPPGCALPTEQVLATSLRVSQPTIHRALRRLEAAGILERSGRTRLVARGPDARHPALRDTALFIGHASTSAVRDRPELDGMWDAVGRGFTRSLHAAGIPVLSLPGDTRAEALADYAAAGSREVVIQADDLPPAAAQALVTTAEQLGLQRICYGDAEAWPGCSTVSSDQEAGTARLVHHLHALGCRRILRLWLEDATGHSEPWFAHRDRGYATACDELGLPPQPALYARQVGIEVPPQESLVLNTHLLAGYLAAAMHSQAPPDAILAPTDGQVPAIHRALDALDLDPAARPLIAGYDNYWAQTPEARWEPRPPVATIDKDNLEIGAALAALLLATREGGTSSVTVHRQVAPRLVTGFRTVAHEG